MTTDPQTQIVEVRTWLQKHERLIVIVLSLAAVLYFGRRWLDHYYDLASQQVKDTTKTLVDQQDINKDLQKKYDSLTQATNQIISTLQNQNSKLAEQVVVANQRAAQQQAIDTQLSNQQLADRIEQLANQKNIQSNDQGVTLNHDQSVGVTQKLDDAQSLSEKMLLQQQINENQSKQISGLTDERDSCNNLLKSKQQELVDQKKTDEAELKKAKISGFRGRLRWFGAGFVAGFITGKVY